MKSSLVLGSLLLLPAVAVADDNAPGTGLGQPAPMKSFVHQGHDGIILSRQVVDSGPSVPTTDDPDPQLAASLYIYLNKSGATLTPSGTNNSANNQSTIVDTTRNFPAWSVSAADWAIVKGALEDMFAPFGATVSDQPPPAGVRHIEALFGGTAGDALPADQVPPPTQGYILGVSPFTIDCGIIEDSIVFTFTVSAVQLGQSMRQIAEIAAQEIAHSYGLDHALNASDPMTYLDYNGNRSFKAGAVSCGESTPRACGLVDQGYPSCRPNQDSVALLAARIGTGGNPGDINPPTLSITAPQNAALVPPDFTVYVNADDDNSVTSVDLYVDDILTDTVVTAPYQLHADGLALGDHQLRVVASDGIQETSRELSVTVDEGADPVDPGDPGDPNDPGNGGDDYVTGGCSAGGHGGAGLLLGLAAIGLLRRRRR